MVFGLLGLSKGFSPSRARNDDDFSDKINHRFTTAMLIAFSIIVTSNQLVGDRIHCWVPAHFSGSWEEYADSYCWIKNTYYLPFDEEIPKSHEVEKRELLPYYQWVPLILLAQAFLFYVPCLIWRNYNTRSGVDVNSIVETAQQFHQADKIAQREDMLARLTRMMHRFFTSRDLFKRSCNLSCSWIFARILCPLCGHRKGNYLVTLYICIKILFIINAVGQLFLVDLLLGRDFHFYGIDMIRSWATGEDLITSPRFPRVTMCDFNARILGNVQRYTVQCTLPINLFHEKIYLVIWFWMVTVALISCLSFALWVMRFLFRIDRHRYMKKHIRVAGRMVMKSDKAQLVNFTERYLQPDGVFVIRLIAQNTDAITATEIASALFDKYRDPYKDELQSKDAL